LLVNLPADDQMKHVELEQFSFLSSDVSNDNPLQFVLCEILKFSYVYSNIVITV